MSSNGGYLFAPQDEDPKVAKKVRRAQRVVKLRAVLAMLVPVLLLTGSAFAAGLMWDTNPFLVLIPLGFVLMTINSGT